MYICVVPITLRKKQFWPTFIDQPSLIITLLLWWKLALMFPKLELTYLQRYFTGGKGLWFILSSWNVQQNCKFIHTLIINIFMTWFLGIEIHPRMRLNEQTIVHCFYRAADNLCQMLSISSCLTDTHPLSACLKYFLHQTFFTFQFIFFATAADHLNKNPSDLCEFYQSFYIQNWSHSLASSLNLMLSVFPIPISLQNSVSSNGTWSELKSTF